MRYQRSSALYKEAENYIPGGVNSPVRAFKNVGGTPVYIQKAQGAYLYDEDGNRYVDYVNSWGPMIYGHAYLPVVDAIIEKARLGTSFGAPTEIETDIAKLAIEMVPHIDKIRFVNSGTEACMSAIRLSRGFTGREKIIKFVGCYHGHADSFLIAGGSGLSTFGVADSAGVTQGAAKDTLLADYNNLESVIKLFEYNKGQIACIIIEPVAGNMGCIAPSSGFLEGLRKLCDQYKALLIFDEVMTGFRLSKGGAQEYFRVRADIVTYGKVIGGGLPVGAFAARNEIMDLLAPLGDVYQAGTLSGNPLAMAAGIEMLKALHNDAGIYQRLEEKAAYLERGIIDIINISPIECTLNRVGSMVSVFFTGQQVTDFNTAILGDNLMFKYFFHELLDNGVYIAPSPFESWFLSDALEYKDLDFTLEIMEKAFKVLTAKKRKKQITA